MTIRTWVMAAALLACVTSCGETGASAPAPESDLLRVQPVPPATEFTHRPVCKNSGHLCSARVRTDMAGHILFHYSPQGYGPADLASAYNFDPSIDPHATIAVTGAYGYSSAESDLAKYRSTFGLPECTKASGCFKVVNQDGKTSPLPADPPGDPKNGDWTLETSLDLAMASAACPKCKILLVQANGDQDLADMFAAIATAVSLKATVISNSWGAPEGAIAMFSGQPPTYWDAQFKHPGITIFASSGDQGYDDGGNGPDFPSTSQYVVAVGGTTLNRAANARGWTETAWGGGSAADGAGGSACSTMIPKPAWQKDSPCPYKASADVSAIGDTNTGVAVYNDGPTARMFGGGVWTVVGGTSAAAPLVAGIFALSRVSSLPPSFAYQNPGAFNDITSGTNGTCAPMDILCNAGTGWDGPTGVGTPNGALIAATQGVSDGQPCTADTGCQSRHCIAATCCNTDCDAQCGSCSTGQCEPLTGPACNDQNPCTHDDVCTNGVCAGTPMDCGPAVAPCTLPPTCSWATVTCVPGLAAADGTSCDDGNPCTSGDTCKAGVCAGTPAQGACPEDDCNLAGQCDTTGKCIHSPKPDGTACDDANPCTSNDQCTAGVCAGKAITCPSPDDCHVAGACSPTKGCPTTYSVLDDGTPCDDHDACTTDETCIAGVCTGTPFVNCDETTCRAAGSCDPRTGKCLGTPKADGVSCDDGDPTTIEDKCLGGECVGTFSECGGKADGTTCSAGVCKAGACGPKGCGCGAAGSGPLSGTILAAGMLALLRRRRSP
jgi:hypothetical protein